MIFDSHCHLDPRTCGGDEGVDLTVATAKAAGVTRMINVGAGYGEGSAERAVRVAERHEGVWASVGIHPHDASHLDDAVMAELRALCARPKVVAWGEIGLDYFYDHSPRDIQRLALRRQIRAALELGLPIIIHDRDSEGETFSILEEENAFQGAGVLYHCYAGDLAQAEALIEAGGHLSIPGTVTYRKSTVQQEVAARVPLERLLVETDSPFLTPEPLRGRKNEPAHVALVVDFVATLRGMDPEALAAATTANTLRFFRLATSHL